MNSIILEAACYRSVGFNDFSTSVLPAPQIEQWAMSMLINHLNADPARLAHGCVLCSQENRHTAVRNAYCTYLGQRQGSDLQLEFSATLLCDEHAHKTVTPSVPLADTGHLLTHLEMITLHEFVIEQLTMPDGIWDVEIELGGLNSDELLVRILESGVDTSPA